MPYAVVGALTGPFSGIRELPFVTVLSAVNQTTPEIISVSYHVELRFVNT
jgi:hypothetical protein